MRIVLFGTELSQAEVLALMDLTAHKDHGPWLDLKLTGVTHGRVPTTTSCFQHCLYKMRVNYSYQYSSSVVGRAFKTIIGVF